MLTRRTFIPAALSALAASQAIANDRPGTLLAPITISSQYVPARRIQVWLPPEYRGTGVRYPVIYMHDGQHAFAADFHTGDPFGTWKADTVLADLIDRRRVRPAIIVAIDNGFNRAGEYMPQKAFDMARARGIPVETSVGQPVNDIQSDNYLRFLTQELKPYIDSHFPTAAGRSDTYIMGSSMGGLISAYALCEYPEVFGAAACLSTHWIIGEGIVIDYLAQHMPDPKTHRVYFDHGTTTLDAQYGPYQQRADQVFIQAGFHKPTHFDSRVFQGAAHNEESWAKRLHVPLSFLLRR